MWDGVAVANDCFPEQMACHHSFDLQRQSMVYPFEIAFYLFAIKPVSHLCHGAYLSCHCVRDRVHPGRVVGPSQEQTTMQQRQTTMHSHSEGQFQINPNISEPK